VRTRRAIVSQHPPHGGNRLAHAKLLPGRSLGAVNLLQADDILPGVTWISCGAATELSAGEQAQLDAVPHAANVIERVMRCDLHADHDGQHFALGQPGDDTEWWLRWQPGEREIVKLVPCPATEPPEPSDIHQESTLCLLFEGHPGEHHMQ
jgi:hypothetical protein